MPPERLEAGCPTLDELERHAAAGGADAAIAAHLDRCEACRAVAASIRHDNDLLAEFVDANADRLPGGDRVPALAIPGYELKREIHRGAQGVVYEAIQLGAKRTVAIKTLVQGAFATSRQRHRFEREVELVAELRHPSIVTLHDSGRTPEGDYFLVMEHVEGRALDDFCSDLRSRMPAGRGRTRSILRLFATVCEAVNAAHQRGIMHRDLKPANILVDEAGLPRVLDFGLAKRAEVERAAAAHTVEGEFIGTIAYAAPEQLSGGPEPVDLRADVFALGVLLYEMLTGRRPHAGGGSMASVVGAIVEEDAAPPGRHDPTLDDEVETIVLTALARDPDRRYQIAGALLADVRHYLAGEPIAAKRDSQWYMLRKTLARHRVAVAVAALFVVLVLGFGVTMAVLYTQSVVARAEKTIEAEKATATLEALLNVLASEQLTQPVHAGTMSDLFGEADRVVAAHLAEQPLIAAAVRRELGLILLQRGSYEAAGEQLRRVLELQDTHGPEDRAALADAHHNLGRALWFMGRYDEAEEQYRRALAMRQALHGPRHEDVAQSMSHLAAALRRQGKFDEAEQQYRAVLELRRRIHGPTHEWVAASLNNLGVCLRDRRKLAEALALFEEALAMVGGLDPGAAPDRHVAQAMHNVASCHLGLGNLDEAERVLDEALEIKGSLFEEDHPSVALSRYAQGQVLYARGELDPARTRCAAALAAQEASLGSAHADVADSLELLGRISLAAGAPEEAEPLLRRSVEIRMALLPRTHWRIHDARSVLGEAVVRSGRGDDARPLLEDAYRQLAAQLGEGDPLTEAARRRLELVGASR